MIYLCTYHVEKCFIDVWINKCVSNTYVFIDLLTPSSIFTLKPVLSIYDLSFDQFDTGWTESNFTFSFANYFFVATDRPLTSIDEKCSYGGTFWVLVG